MLIVPLFVKVPLTGVTCVTPPSFRLSVPLFVVSDDSAANPAVEPHRLTVTPEAIVRIEEAPSPSAAFGEA